MFFAVLKEARRLHIEEKNNFLADLVNVAAAGMGGKVYEEILGMFQARTSKKRERKAHDASSEDTARILSSMLKPARIMAGGVG